MNQSYFKSNDFEDKKLVRDKNVPLFFFIFVFSIQLTVNNAQFNFADDWIQSTALPTEPQPLPRDKIVS